MPAQSGSSMINAHQPVVRRVCQLVSSNGDGTGTTNLNTTAAEYPVAPGSGVVYELQRMNVVLNGDNGEYFSVEIRDDLTGLTEHKMQVQGYKAIS